MIIGDGQSMPHHPAFLASGVVIPVPGQTSQAGRLPHAAAPAFPDV
jgi:hypothetical protein